MKSNTEQPWLEAGYEIFSKEGITGLKVEILSRKVGISKSSFYHLFVDIDIFIEKLFDFHIEQAKVISELAKECKTLEPELINLLVSKKKEMLFNRQLCINRDNQLYQLYFEKAFKIVETSFFDKWVMVLGLNTQPNIARNILKIYSDNFFLRITEENLTYEWLIKMLDEIKLLVKDINR